MCNRFILLPYFIIKYAYNTSSYAFSYLFIRGNNLCTLVYSIPTHLGVSCVADSTERYGVLDRTSPHGVITQKNIFLNSIAVKVEDSYKRIFVKSGSLVL
jgi:hypothetical protein